MMLKWEKLSDEHKTLLGFPKEDNAHRVMNWIKERAKKEKREIKKAGIKIWQNMSLEDLYQVCIK